MRTGWPEMTPWDPVIAFEHGVSFSSESMTSENSDLDTIVVEECPTISKVPRRLREVNEKAYVPNVISIGPYHYRKPHLARLQDLKKRWFEKFVEKPHLGLHQFREAMKLLEEKTRKCYEPLPPDLEDEEKFVDMMVYDGCFVVRLIQKRHLRDFSKLGRHVPKEMLEDLLLLENQLPFFVLLKLYSMIEPNPGPKGHINDLATSALFFFGRNPWSVPQDTSIRHLLHLVRTTFHLSGIQADVAREVNLQILTNSMLSATDPEKAETQAEIDREENLQILLNSMRSATELEKAGIRFLPAPIRPMQFEEQWIENVFDVELDDENKELKIPALKVNDSTERMLRNYMAYEELCSGELQNCFVDYVIFMHKLIKTDKDVELLCKRRIIDNLLGNNEKVTQMFGKRRDSKYYCSEGFNYEYISNKLIRHCSRKRSIWKAKWNTWMKILQKDYFNNPWSYLSFLAALVLLLLTMLQTIFSALSYYHGRQ